MTILIRLPYLKLGSQLIQRGWRQQVKDHMLISLENCTSPKPKLPFIWILQNCWYGWRSESCVCLIQVLLIGHSLLMGEDGLAAGLQLLALPVSSTSILPRLPLTLLSLKQLKLGRSAWTDLQLCCLNCFLPDSSLLLPVTWKTKASSVAMARTGTDWGLAAKLWKKGETGVEKEVHLKMGSTSLLPPGPSSMSSVGTRAELPSSCLYVFAFRPCMSMWFRVLKKSLILWSQMVGAQGGQWREQAVHLAIQSEIRGPRRAALAGGAVAPPCCLDYFPEGMARPV